jgi:hypothetical protein
VGRPNISPRGSGDLKIESELPLLSSEPFAAIPPTTEGPPLSEEIPPRPLVGLLEEKVIDGEQGREEEEKEKEKEKEEEEELKFVCIKSVLCFLGKMGNS